MQLHAFDTTLRALTYLVAVAILLNLFDDLFIDLNYFLRGLHRRAVRRLTRDELVSQKQQRIAILVPAWKEAEVIAEMLEHNLRSIDYDTARYTIFCGTYQNDPGTQACVDYVARSSASVRKVVVPHEGPTSKADCLNWVYQGIILEEEQSGERFDILLMHDAEDIIHPLSLRLYNYLVPRYDFVQTPVFSLELKLDQIVAGTYIDEFAEHHLKDMLVREAIGGLIPSAGVGSAFARNAFEEIASAHEQKPFNVESLTEDYEIAIKFRLANKRVHFACRTLERPAEPDGSLGTGEEYLATREYFPSGFGASVRQRSRWLCGITLQTWQQVGWQGSLPVLYCLWRDRKAVVMNLVVLLAYALVLQLAMMAALAPLMHSDWNLQHVVPTGSLLSLLLSANACALLWRAGLKAYFVGRLYGPVQALLSAPRLIAGNAISVLATLRALRQYATYRITGEPLRWLKTAHVFPNARTLRARARMLGECLLESGLISADELSQALLLQRGTNLQLGAVLTLSGLVSGNTVTGVLSEQWGIEPSFQIDPRSIPLELLRTLSEHDAERLDVLPLSSTDKEVSIAVARQLPLHERTQLEGLLGAPVRPCLVDRELLQRARQKAYRRLVSAPVLQPLAADGRAPLLGERLVAAGQLSQSDLERALTEQTESGELLGELLDRRGFVTASGVAEGLQLWSSAAPLEQTALDRDAMAKLGFAFCALYSILPLASASGARRFLASPFPLPDAVITRANAELSESLEFAYAPLFQVRAGLARAQREQRVTPDSELAGVPALDRCEIRAITSLGAFRGSTRELWQRCSADALAPVEYLEAAGLVTQAEAAGLRSETYRIELDSDVAPQPPPTAAASLLPPSWLQRHDIRVVQATTHSAVLATAKPSPELARLVARCLPTWAIEWRVAGPPLSAARSEPRPRKSWNNNKTIN